MLLGDTLEFKAEKGKRKNSSEEENTDSQLLLKCIHCVFHWKIDGDIFIKKSICFDSALRGRRKNAFIFTIN